MRNAALGVPALVAAAMLIVSAPAVAQMARPACATVSDNNLPADLKAWTGSRASEAAAAAGAAVPAIAPGVPYRVNLVPAAKVKFAKAPGQFRTPENSHAGLVRLTIATPGTYRISASTALWLDVRRDGTFAESTAHGALAPCTSIHKVVEFPLVAGDYTLQLSGNPGASVILMVTPKS